MNRNIFYYLATLVALASIAGCEGPSGPAGPSGPPGLVGISDYEIVVRESEVNKSLLKQLEVACPEGKKTFGAGWSVLDATGAILDGRATYYQPEYDGSGWLVNAQYGGDSRPDWKLRLRVICARVDK